MTAAEVAFAAEGPAAARAAVTAPPPQATRADLAARLDLVEGLIAAGERLYDDAQRLFRAPAPRLDAERRAVAENAGFFSRALADPAHAEAPTPASHTAGGALARAYAQAVLLDVPAAIAELSRAEARFPDQAALPAARAQLAMLLDDRPQAQAAIARWPSTPTTRARWKPAPSTARISRAPTTRRWRIWSGPASTPPARPRFGTRQASFRPPAAPRARPRRRCAASLRCSRWTRSPMPTSPFFTWSRTVPPRRIR